MNLNKIFIIGNITRDPEVRATPNGQSVATISVATNRQWTDQQGQKKSEVEYHNVVLWRRLAEIAGQYLKKGSLVMIEGRIKTRSWEDQNGQKRYATEIVAENMQMGPKGAGGGSRDSYSGPQSSPQGENQETKETIPEIDIDGEEKVKPEDIPF